MRHFAMTEAQAKILMTGDDLLNMPEEATEGYELIEGELVKMAPTGLEHGNVELGVGAEIRTWNKQSKRGRVFAGEIGFYIHGHDRTVRAADVAYMSYERLPADANLEGYSRIAPDLVVEVISPGNTAEEMEVKIREWFDFGVRLAWVIYPRTRRVHVYTTPDKPVILDADATLDGGDVLPGFSVPIAIFFED
jgi:Uma2 family endonuclease